MRDLISIIIPVYNTGDKILKCIDSIEKNTYKNIEVIIVDDGSKKETADICEECKNNYQNITVYHTENNGVSSARNFGIEKVKGSYIMFVDADDVLALDAIEELYNICKTTNSDFAICSHKECTIKEMQALSNTLLSKKTEHPQNEYKTIVGKDILEDFLNGKKIGWSVWGKLYKKELIENIRFPIEKQIAEDMYFIYQVCRKANSCVKTDLQLYYYIKYDESAMKSKNNLKFFDTYCLTKKVFNDNQNDKLYTKFYLKNALWFFKFMNSKKLDSICKNKINETRREFLNITKKINVSKYGKSIYFDYLLLKYFYLVFKIYSKIYFKTYRKLK